MQAWNSRPILIGQDLNRLKFKENKQLLTLRMHPSTENHQQGYEWGSCC